MNFLLLHTFVWGVKNGLTLTTFYLDDSIYEEQVEGKTEQPEWGNLTRNAQLKVIWQNCSNKVDEIGIVKTILEHMWRGNHFDALPVYWSTGKKDFQQHTPPSSDVNMPEILSIKKDLKKKTGASLTTRQSEFWFKLLRDVFDSWWVCVTLFSLIIIQ